MNNLVSFVAPIYNFYPIMIDSVLLQLHKNVEVIAVHDGEPNESTLKIIQEKLKDSRVKYIQTDKRYNDWGHTPRRIGLQNISNDSDYVVISGGDNYYAPGYCTELLLNIKPHHVGVYCNCVHDKISWTTVNARIEAGFIDGGCIMIRSKIAKEIDWFSTQYAADWHYIEAINNKYGIDKFIKVDKTLFIHN